MVPKYGAKRRREEELTVEAVNGHCSVYGIRARLSDEETDVVYKIDLYIYFGSETVPVQMTCSKERALEKGQELAGRGIVVVSVDPRNLRDSEKLALQFLKSLMEAMGQQWARRCLRRLPKAATLLAA